MHEGLHGGGDPCSSPSVCGLMAWASLLQTAQHHHSLHSNSVRILLLLIILISALKRDHIAGIKVSLDLTRIMSCWKMMAPFYPFFFCLFICSKGDTIGVFSNCLLHTAIKVGLVNRANNLIRVVTSCWRCVSKNQHRCQDAGGETIFVTGLGYNPLYLSRG